MQPWKTSVICAGKHRPRQFEYHPLYEDVVVFGTVKGEAVVADVATNRVCSSICDGLAKDRGDPILGLCWLKRSPSRFVVGSSHGYLRMCDAGELPSAGRPSNSVAAVKARGCSNPMMGKYQSTSDDLGSRAGAVVEGGTTVPFGNMASSGWRSKGGVCAEGGGGGSAVRIRELGGGLGGDMDTQFSGVGQIVTEFESFEKLTSVHVNSTDDHMLTSGYTYGVRLFDIATGVVLRNFADIHEDHINISRFANHSPFVFATSSFDRTVKAWDSRFSAKIPIYTCRSDLGHVMLSFSPDDVFLLTSAVDNEIKQYLAVDGRLHMDLDVPKTGLEENFTRSYYTSSGRLILSGSSEEQTVRLYCAQTGRLIHSAEMYPGRKHGSLYVQSLRGDPHDDFKFSVLVNYRDTAYPLEIVNVDMLKGTDGEDLRPLMAYTSSSKLSADLGRACVDKEGTDAFLVARDKSRFAAHRAVLACRSSVLATLIADVMATGGSSSASSFDTAAAATGEEEKQYAGGVGCHGGEGGRAEQETVTVYLPRAVVPEIVPVILAFLYTDKLETDPENGPDGFAREYLDPEKIGRWRGLSAAVAVEGIGTAGECHSKRRIGELWNGADGSGGDLAGAEQEGGPDGEGCSGEGMRELLVCERVLEAAEALGLERLRTLVEWQCRGLINNATVVSVASMALRQKAEQLLRYCVYYLGTHYKVVVELHGRDRLPLLVQAKVDAERQRSVYALSRDRSEVAATTAAATAGTEQIPTLSPPQNHSPNGSLAPVAPAQPGAPAAPEIGPPQQPGAGGGAVDAVHNALDGAIAAAAAAVEAAWAHAQALTGGAGGGGGAAAAMAWVVGGQHAAGVGAEEHQQANPALAAVVAAGDGDVDGDDDGDDVGDMEEEDEYDVLENDEIDFDALDVDDFNGNDGDVGVDLGEANEEDDDDDVDDGGDDDDDVDDGGEENFVDEEVEEEGHGSTSEDELVSSEDEDEGPWHELTRVGGLPGEVRRRLVPKVTGHTATAVLGSQMVVLGGGNKRQFHSCRHVPVYDPIERTWTKLSTRGAAPQALIYHSTTALEPPWAYPRNLLVFGGNSASHTAVMVLDSLTMEWSRPVIEGEGVGVRTRHTAVAVHSDFDEYDRAHLEGKRDETPVNQFTKLTAEQLATTSGRLWRQGDTQEQTASPTGKRCGKDCADDERPRQASLPISKSNSTPSRRDLGGDTDVIIFGGYSPFRGQAFNDVLVLSVRRSFGYNAGNSANNRSSSNNSASRSSPSHRRRRRHSYGNHPLSSTWDSDSDSDCDNHSSVKPDDNKRQSGSFPFQRRNGSSGSTCGVESNDGGARQGQYNSKSHSSQGYRYRWITPTVRGTPPGTRLAHAAAVVRVVEGDVFSSGAGVGVGVGKEVFMVVFGGVGTGALYNDTHVLRCGSTTAMEWESRVHVRGRPPARRYGHSMVALNPPPGNCGYAKMAVFGGTSGQYAFNDIFVLTLSWAKIGGMPCLTADWECLSKNIEGPMPCPRSRQTMCQINGELIIFGGSDEAPVTASASHARSKEVDTYVYHVRPRLKKRPLPEYPAPTLGLRQWHERAMAREVTSVMGLVLAAEKRRNAAAAAVATDMSCSTPSPTSDARKFIPANGEDPIVPVPPLGGIPVGASLDTQRSSMMGEGERIRVDGLTNRTQGKARAAAEGRVMVFGARGRRGWVNPRLLRRPSPSSGGTEFGKKPKPSYGVKVVWESIRPETFVYEAGPEPPVIVKPITLHKDMHSLVGSSRFSDVQFRFQAVNFNEPTTPTNTAHYAIVPPPTPTLSPQPAFSSSPSVGYATPTPTLPWASPLSRAGHSKTPYSTTSAPVHSTNGGPSSRGNGRCLTSPPTGTAVRGDGAGIVARGERGSCYGRAASGGSSTAARLGDMLSGSGFGGVGDEEGLSAQESRTVRRAHHSVLPSFPDSMSPKWTTSRTGSGCGGFGGSNGDGAGGIGKSRMDGETDWVNFPVWPLSPAGPATGDERSRDMRVRSRSRTVTASRGGAASEGGGGETDARSPFRGAKKKGARGRPQRAQHTVVTRSSAGQEWAASPSRTSPAKEWALADRHYRSGLGDETPTSRSPSMSPVASGRGDSTGAGGKRRFFALSQAADVAEVKEQERETTVAGGPEDCGQSGCGGSWCRCDADGDEGHEKGRRACSTLSSRHRSREMIDAHRMVVSLRSEPMRAMLRSGMKESFTAEALVKDIRAPVFSALLTYLYADTLQLKRPEDIMELLVVANQYTLTDLVSLCEGFLQEVFDTENAAHLYHYADALGMRTFEHRVLSFIMRHWTRVSRTEDWKRLPSELKERANAFRTSCTHLFMLGQKDHVLWAKGGRKPKLAAWVHDHSWADPDLRESDDEEECCTCTNQKDGGCLEQGLLSVAPPAAVAEGGCRGVGVVAGNRDGGEEGWTTAPESEEGGVTSDDSAAAEYFSTRSQSSGDLSIDA